MIHFNHFDFLSPTYDRLIKPSDPSIMRSLLGLPASGFLLDVGGGTGRSAIELVDQISNVIIADSSLGMLNQAIKKGSFSCICTNAEELPFPNESVDRIIMVDALHHVKDFRITLSELWRVVKPGGRIVIEEPDIRYLQIKLMALFEKIILMRSRFISPVRIQEQFTQPNAYGEIMVDGTTAWVVIEKRVA